MNAKEYLLKYYGLLSEIKQRQDMIERLRENAVYKSALFENAERCPERKKEDIIIQYCDLEQKCLEKQSQAEKSEAYILDIINTKLNFNERLVIKMRYIDLISWEDIANITGYSKRQCFRIHSNALNKLKECIKNEYNTAHFA